MALTVRMLSLLFLLSAGVSEVVSDDTQIGFGVLGDSNSDEYQHHYPSGKYAETPLSWVELMVRTRGLDFGPWGERAEPRRT